MTVPGPNTPATPASYRYSYIPRWNHAAHKHQDILAAEALQLGDGLRHERLVAARQARDAQHVDIVLDGHANRLAGGLK